MGNSMTRPSLRIALAFLFAANFVLGGQQLMATSGPWSGIIINSGCTADEAFAEADKCTDNVPGAKLVLYDDTTREMFNLEPQTPAMGHLGDAVSIAVGVVKVKNEFEIRFVVRPAVQQAANRQR
jgi:hypothetical protein